MKTLEEFDFVEKKDSQKEIESRLTYFAMSEIKGGAKAMVSQCDPWYGCDAWNCNPDCICKSSLC